MPLSAPLVPYSRKSVTQFSPHALRRRKNKKSGGNYKIRMLKLPPRHLYPLVGCLCLTPDNLSLIQPFLREDKKSEYTLRVAMKEIKNFYDAITYASIMIISSMAPENYV
ncbi:MAG: hypothetical protein WBB23_13410 [Desulforhopalus sp.]